MRREGDRMSAAPIVLKFGSSVLRSPDDLTQVVSEIYGHVRRGRRVIAVVSAFGDTTQRLLDEVQATCPDAPADLLVPHVASGETRSASLLGLALTARGLDARVLRPEDEKLFVRGSRLDAELVGFDGGCLRTHLERHPVVVLPGFVGWNERGEACLLGRGGSDATALVVAVALGASCHLIKDVSGFFEWDPARGGSPRRYACLSWDRALELGGNVVQAKALAFARERALPFVVRACGDHVGTRVGRLESCLAVEPLFRSGPLKVTLLGAGTVGGEVMRRLQHERQRYQLVAVCVRDLAKERRITLPADVSTDDMEDALARPTDVVVELVGGEAFGRRCAERAFPLGCDVVTANKELVARHGPALRASADVHGVEFLHSGAVGGGLPAIEHVQEHVRRSPIRRIVGVLNGTSNFVLDRLAAGDAFETAIREAQRQGFAEADPTRDLDGRDAADKLAILARFAFPGKRFELGSCRGLRDDRRTGGRLVRQVAEAVLVGDVVRGRVDCRSVDANSPLGSISGCENALGIEDATGRWTWVRGRGAGPLPTAEAVLADLAHVVRQRAERQEVAS